MTVTTPRLLVVSESRITRRVVEMTFADQAVELVTASTGPDGLAEWERHPASVVIADLAMDGLDGLSLARTLADRAGERAPSVLLMAGQNDLVDDAAVVAAGVRAVLRKPLDSLQLVDAVRSATRAGRPPEAPPASDAAASTGRVETASASVPAVAPVPEPVAAAPGGGVDLGDEDLERVAARVAAIWSGDVQREQRVAALMAERAEQVAASSAAAAVERVAPAAASEAAERLVRELAPKLVAEVARLVVADVSERLVREEIARMRAAHPGR